MKSKIFACWILSVAFVMVSPTYAHHGYAAYDMSKTIVLTGSVTEFTLANPHSSLAFDAKDEKGEAQHWSMEFGYLRILRQAGWTPDTLKPGDQITATFHPAKNGAHVGALTKLLNSQGQEIPLNPAQSREPKGGSQ